MQVDPAALERELIDLALAVVLTPSLERQQFCVPREPLEGGQQVSHSHPSLLCQAELLVLGVGGSA
jgi:hypothetical protein